MLLALLASPGVRLELRSGAEGAYVCGVLELLAVSSCPLLVRFVKETLVLYVIFFSSLLNKTENVQ